MNIFKKPDLKDVVRKNDRVFRTTQRDLERDRRQLSRQEKQLSEEIRQIARKGDRETCKALAKQLINLRKQNARSVGVSAKMTGLNMQTKTMSSNVRIADAVKTSTKSMQMFESRCNPMKLAKTLKQFEEGSSRLDMSEELINDALDGIMNESGDEEEEQQVIDQVLDEIGIETSQKMPKLPVAAQRTRVPEKRDSSEITDKELQDMLNELKT